MDTLYSSKRLPKNNGGPPRRLQFLKNITIGGGGSDDFLAYYYKFVPFDSLGTGDHVSFARGLRINSINEKPDIPSGVKIISDPSKTVGTNIEGDTIVHSYLTWKKDRLFTTKSYEVEVQDLEENQSQFFPVPVPELSGITYMISGTGEHTAFIDHTTNEPLMPTDISRSAFDIFSAHGSSGIKWTDHTVYLDKNYLPGIANSFQNVQSIEIAAGNTSSGFLYFTGNSGYTANYSADNTFLSDEDHLLVARRFNADVLAEYEPRIKIPVKADSQYAFRVRAVDNPKSNFSPKKVFTASGDQSHFSFNRDTAELSLGGTGDVTVSGPFVTTVGGSGIHAIGTGAVVVGGVDNRLTGEYSAIVGGFANRVHGNLHDPAEFNFLGGGYQNVISGTRSIIVGGRQNLISGDMQAIVGGDKNVLFSHHDKRPDNSSDYTGHLELSFIGGGEKNVISGQKNIIGGGSDNQIGIQYVPHGDLGNIGDHTKGPFLTHSSAILGGNENLTRANYTFIGGGKENTIW